MLKLLQKLKSTSPPSTPSTQAKGSLKKSEGNDADINNDDGHVFSTVTTQPDTSSQPISNNTSPSPSPSPSLDTLMDDATTMVPKQMYLRLLEQHKSQDIQNAHHIRLLTAENKRLTEQTQILQSKLLESEYRLSEQKIEADTFRGQLQDNKDQLELQKQLLAIEKKETEKQEREIKLLNDKVMREQYLQRSTSTASASAYTSMIQQYPGYHFDTSTGTWHPRDRK